MEIGKDIGASKLLEEYDAIFIGIGLGKDRTLKLPGEEGRGVFPATALIRELKNNGDFKIPERVVRAVIIGGGNTAIDVARELAKTAESKV